MKEIYLFLKWQLNKWSASEIIYLIAASLFVCSALESDRETSIMLLRIAVTLIMLILIKWTVFDRIKDSWNKYKQEKRDLFNTIDQGK